MASDPRQELENYHAPTVWAIAALVLGLASTLAILGAMLWVLPVFGVLTAGRALWVIHCGAPRVTGRGMALVGLALSLVFGAAAPARDATRHYWLATRSRLVADEWFEYLRRGESYRAQQLTLLPEMRHPFDASLKESIDKDPSLESGLPDYTAFIARPEIKALLAAGDKAQIAAGPIRVIADHGRDFVTREYDLRFHDPRWDDVQLTLRLDRLIDKSTGKEAWQIHEIGTVPLDE